LIAQFTSIIEEGGAFRNKLMGDGTHFQKQQSRVFEKSSVKKAKMEQ
jgi:hypothetical protein